MKKKFSEELPLFEMVINEDEIDGTGVRLLSLVDKAATGIKGLCFSEDVVEMKFSMDEEKQEIVAPALVPDLRIRRKSPDGYYYNVFFSVDTIQKIVRKYFAKGSNRRINVNHSTEMVDAYIFESWFVENQDDKAIVKYGFNVPAGTWMVRMKIEDSEFWNTKVKKEGISSFSVEGLFGEKFISKYSFSELIDELSEDELFEIARELEFKIIKGSTKSVETSRASKTTVNSSNVHKFRYDTKTNELIVKFHSGDTYTYYDVPVEDFYDFSTGEGGTCTTEGSNIYGSWYDGKNPSIGAAVWDVLRGRFAYAKTGTL
jgi:hypothetical protein